MELTYIDYESRRVIPIRGGLAWHKDKAGRFWIWSEKLEQNLAMKQANEVDALKEALNMTMFIISMKQEQLDALRAFKSRFDAFAEGEGLVSRSDYDNEYE